VKLTPKQLSATDLRPVVGACTHFMRCDNARHFIFDMQGVEFMTSPCRVSLILFMQDLGYIRGHLVWVQCHGNIESLFRGSHLDAWFDLCADDQEAMEVLSDG
jgi:anti-anti-sigma regulatory factor